MNSTQISAQNINKGLWLGLLGVTLFAATLPMTKLAVGSVDAPQLSPWFVTFGRAEWPVCYQFYIYFGNIHAG